MRIQDRLRQQRQTSDRGLQLVGDVRHEVAPDLLQPAGLAAVLDEEQDVGGPERRDAGPDD